MIEVEVVDTERDFRALEDDWRRLACQSPDVSYFLTWEYTCLKWDYFSADRVLYVLTARENGELVGILPLSIAHKSIGPLPIRRLEFLCRAEHPAHFFPYDGENMDVIALPAHKDAVAAAFLQHLDRHCGSWDVADIGWLSSDSKLVSHFKNASVLSMTQLSPCYITTLPDDWSTYEQNVLGKSEAKRIRRHARRLERDYPDEVDYHLITDRSEISPAMDNLIEMNLRRWSSVGQATVFDDDRFVRFHREFVESAFDRGWVRLYQLRVGEDVLAATCGIVVHDSYFLFQKGFDPEWSRYGPGAVLQAFELGKAIDEGSRVYDWAHGARESKITWIDVTRDDVQVIAPRSWKGYLYLGKEAGWSQGKTLLRRLLPASAYQQLKRIISRAKRS